jgi:two-component system chemotaxis response regulator CheB
MFRVLIADDSPTLRFLIRTILESDPDLEVVGEACNGKEAVALCHKLQPDIITMDVRMPELNGFQAIRRIMAESPRPIMVLTSTTSDFELGISFKAIEAGALMVVGKPHGLPGDDPEADQLVAQVKAMADVKVVRRRWSTLETPPVLPNPALRPLPGPPRLIVIGASTGGPPALHAILSQLPADYPIPIAVVQHISPGFVSGLARWLDQTVPLRVKLAESGEYMQAGVVYIAPDDGHLLVTQDNQISLRMTPAVRGHRPSVTALFESAAQSFGYAAVGVLLTGMGDDGARGLKALHNAGAFTIAQDKDTCVVFGMPKEAIALDAVETVLPLDLIGVHLKKFQETKSGRVTN